MDSRVHEVINVNKVVANTSSSAVIMFSVLSRVDSGNAGLGIQGHQRCCPTDACRRWPCGPCRLLGGHLRRAGIPNLGTGILNVVSDSTHNKF